MTTIFLLLFIPAQRDNTFLSFADDSVCCNSVTQCFGKKIVRAANNCWQSYPQPITRQRVIFSGQRRESKENYEGVGPILPVIKTICEHEFRYRKLGFKGKISFNLALSSSLDVQCQEGKVPRPIPYLVTVPSLLLFVKTSTDAKNPYP